MAPSPASTASGSTTAKETRPGQAKPRRAYGQRVRELENPATQSSGEEAQPEERLAHQSGAQLEGR